MSELHGRPHKRKTRERTSKKSQPLNDLAIGSPVRVSRLDTLVAVRAELGRLYREARKHAGRYPDPNTALKLAMILNQYRQVIELAEFEARLVALEKRDDADPS